MHASPSTERLCLAALWGSMLAPVVAHTVFRPLLVALGAMGDAGWVTLAALLVAAVAVVARWRWPAVPGPRWACTVAVAVVAALIIGGSTRGILAAGGALLAVAAFASLALPIMIRRIPAELDGIARRRRKSTALVIVLGLLAVVQSARLSTFMGDPDRTDAAPIPIATHLNHHACMSAYVQAARLAEARVDNLYDADWWPELGHTETGRAQAEIYAPFGLDAYAYPPPFLLLPRLLLVGGEDFAVQRALWYGLDALSLALGLWLAATWLGRLDGPAGARALVLAPIVWLAPSMLVTLQVGNVHLAITVAAIAAMIAFDRGRPALGGMLLAFSILAKISPGLLGVLLLVRGRWRDAGWTAAFGLLWSLLALVAFGPAPFVAFVRYQLPRLRSGEALAFFTVSASEIASNMAPFGVPFKLEALGLPLDDVWGTASIVGTIFTLLVIGLTIVAARRKGDRRIEVGLWLAVLTLGALRSPFAPAYVGFTALWLLTLWAAEARTARGVVGLVVLYVLLLGLPRMPETTMLVISLVQQAALLGMVVWIIVRPDPARSQPSSGASTAAAP